MPNKSVILTVAAVALAFGLVISGCKRDNRTAMKTTRGDSGRTQSTRPAEVLSASVYRPPVSQPYQAPAYEAPVMVAQVQPQYVQPQYVQTQYAQPQPVQTVQYTQAQYFAQAAQAGYGQTQYAAYATSPQLAYAQAVYAPTPVVMQPRVVQPAPDLVVAKASLPVLPPPPSYQNVPAAFPRAPIPELEPERFQTAPPDRVIVRPAAEIMMSSSSGQQPDRQEIQRALAPLAQSGSRADPRQGWVASPATAMVRGY